MENKFKKRFFKRLNNEFKRNIKLSYVSRESVIIVTNDDKFYEFKRDNIRNEIRNALIALSEDMVKVKSLIEESLIKDLSHKQVIDFKNGRYHIIVRTEEGKLYLWNRFALKNRKRDFNAFQTVFKQYLISENVIDFCCGAFHTLFLTIDGEVYEWYEHEQHLKLRSFNGQKVKAISCGCQHSLALTESGRVFSWGRNDSGQLGIGSREMKFPKPQLVELSELLVIEKISCGFDNSLLLSSDGDIYVCGYNLKGELGTGDRNFVSIPIKLNHSEKFIDMASHFIYPFSAALSKNSVFYIWGDCEEEIITKPKRTELKSFVDIFEYYFRSTYIINKGKLMQFNDDFIQSDRFDDDFIEKRRIGGGSYGDVFEVKSKYLESERYAIKKMKFVKENVNEFFKELEFLPIIYELGHENIVGYTSVWLGNDFDFKNATKIYTNNFILYIQMDLYDISLNEMIDLIKKNSDFFSKTTLTSSVYYIASGIFIQILEGVNYLHKHNPPIIHRDLKPENIMLMRDENDEIVVKIADMGLATLHKFLTPLKSDDLNIESSKELHTIDRGTLEYMAPEVKEVVYDDDNSKAIYDIKADIYSLGVIFKELLFIDNRDNTVDENEESLVNKKYETAKALSIKMNSYKPNERPDCEELLEKKHLWAFTHEELNAEQNLLLENIKKIIINWFPNSIIKDVS